MSCKVRENNQMTQIRKITTLGFLKHAHTQVKNVVQFWEVWTKGIGQPQCSKYQIEAVFSYWAPSILKFSKPCQNYRLFSTLIHVQRLRTANLGEYNRCFDWPFVKHMEHQRNRPNSLMILRILQTKRKHLDYSNTGNLEAYCNRDQLFPPHPRVEK